MAGFLSTALAVLAPERAVKVARAKTQIAAMASAQMHYDGAQRSHRTEGWRRVGGDANVATLGKLGTLRDIARDMVRNDPFSHHAVEVIASNVVGAGIIPQVQGADPQRVAAAEKLLIDHFDSPAVDAAGQMDLYGLQRMGMGAVATSGEVLLRRRRRLPSDGLPLPFQIQVLESDFLDTSKEGPLRNGGYAIQGVEFDALGRRVAYWLFDSHPAGAGFFSPKSRRVPAEDVCHVYRMDRPGQVRGVTWLAPVMMTLNDLRDYMEAQLLRQKVSACYAVFEEDADADASGTGGGIISNREEIEPLPETLEPGMIARLAPGRRISFASPPGVDGYVEYVRERLHAVAAGLGITYAALTGDLSAVNFSSGRMGHLESQRTISGWQHGLIITQMGRTLARWFFEAAALTGAQVGDLRIEWTPPRREMIDPVKEGAAIRDAIRAGQETPSGAIRKLGRDPEEFFREYSQDMARLDQLGLVLDSDARKTARAGSAQPEQKQEGTAGQ